jgi:hypothetical protein
MRTVWRGLVRVVFWSYERGTLPYDLAVAVIVLFVLLSPRSWFNDRPTLSAVPLTAAAHAEVERRGADPIDGAAIYRVDARLLSLKDDSDSDLQAQLHEAVNKHAQQPPRNHDFEILRIAPVRNSEGAIAYYDVGIRE